MDPPAMKRASGAGRAEQLTRLIAAVPLPQAQVVATALGTIDQLRPVARRIGSTIAHQFGLTEDEEHVGWKVLAIIVWELWELKLKAPVKTLWTVEQQVSGLIEQAYKFLGGTATALEDGAALIGNISSEISNALGATEQAFVDAGEWVISL